MDIELTPEPRRYAWKRDGLLVAGTLKDYADMWESDYYCGDDDLTRKLIDWDGEGDPFVFTVHIRRGETDENDMIPYTLYGGPAEETVVVHIDGRA